MVIMTYKRLDSIYQNPMIREVLSLDAILELLLIWNDPNSTATDLDHFRQEFCQHYPDPICSKLRIRQSTTNSLNNRFLPDEKIRTEAIFTIDDDWYIPAFQFQHGFNLWKKYPNKLVGFTARPGFYNDTTKTATYSYQQQEYYNLVLPGGGCFFPRHMFDSYWSPRLEQARQYVHELMNCEDLLFNFLSVDYPPLYVDVNNQRKSFPSTMLTKTKRPGLSNRPGHFIQRGKCLAQFAGWFGWPLVSSNVIWTNASDWNSTIDL